jgi:uncharacterized protein YydD (DUF2326 family)
MLLEIRCEHFNQKCIEFHPGLNVILGDSKASNSIGKTTLLSIIDFIFGGKTYLEHNTGSLEIYGLHSFSFKFLFKNTEYFFTMNTNREKVYKCNSKYEILNQEPLSIDEYLDFLKKEIDEYDLNSLSKGIDQITNHKLFECASKGFIIEYTLEERLILNIFFLDLIVSYRG